MNDTAPTYHPMFPPPEGSTDDPPAIDLIYVERITPQGAVSASRPLSPGELQTPADIAARFGRGTYTLTARNIKGRLAGKVTKKIDFGGDPKSMIVDADDEPTPPPAPRQAAMPAGIPTDPMGMFVFFMQQQREDDRLEREREREERRIEREREREDRRLEAEREQRAHEMQMISHRESTQLLVTALQRPPPPADTTAANVLGQVLAQVIPNTTGAQRGPSPGVKDLKELMELVKAATPAEKKDDDGFQAMIAQAVGAYIGTIQNNQNNRPPQPPPPTGVPDPAAMGQAPPSAPPQPPKEEKEPVVANPAAQSLQTH